MNTVRIIERPAKAARAAAAIGSSLTRYSVRLIAPDGFVIDQWSFKTKAEAERKAGELRA